MAVQVFPFIYTALLIVILVAYSLGSGIVLDIIDYLFFVSPIVVIAHIIYSRMLLMCKWHRIACALPLIPQGADLFDAYIYHFTHYDWVLIYSAIFVTLVLYLICVYKVFFTDNGRICG